MTASSRINAKIANQFMGARVRDKVHFMAEHHEPITPEQAMEAQFGLGYNPTGYGFDGFKVTRDPILLRYKATWYCQASSD